MIQNYPELTPEKYSFDNSKENEEMVNDVLQDPQDGSGSQQDPKNMEQKPKIKYSCENSKENEEIVNDVQQYPQDGPGSQQDPKNTEQKPKINLACEWSTKKIVPSARTASKGAISKVMPPPPQAYLVKDVYRRNREENDRRRAEEERKKREFRPRPVPNFTAHHELLEKRKPVHTVTMAVTPDVLKKSREADERRRKRLEEWKQNNQPPKFEPRPTTVLREKPFVPEKKSTTVKMCPFKLNTEKRLGERKQFDEMKQKALEEKQKQEEEQRKKREEEIVKELRKATVFKARSNPFKN